MSLAILTRLARQKYVLTVHNTHCWGRQCAAVGGTMDEIIGKQLFESMENAVLDVETPSGHALHIIRARQDLYVAVGQNPGGRIVIRGELPAIEAMLRAVAKHDLLRPESRHDALWPYVWA